MGLGRLPLFVAVSVLLNLGIAHALGNLPDREISLAEPPPLKIKLSARAAPPPAPAPQADAMPPPAPAPEAPLPVVTAEAAPEKIAAVTAPPQQPTVLPSAPSVLPAPVQARPVEVKTPEPRPEPKLVDARVPKKPASPEPEAPTPPRETVTDTPAEPVASPADTPSAPIETAAVDSGASSATIMQAARYRHQSPPVYPRRAYELGQQGTVLLFAEVLPNGRPGELKVAESSGHKLLDMSAIAAVRTWEFEPVTIDGKVSATWVRVPVRFVIR